MTELFAMGINLKNELGKIREKSCSQARLLESVRAILRETDRRRSDILGKLAEKPDGGANHFDIDAMDGNRIFHVSHIKKLCIDYRLRFLDTTHFKNGFPAQAISEIRYLEDRHGALSGFKVAAPTSAFKLLNYNDPLLFAPMGNGYYYLIHQWGNDLSRFRKLLVWPFRHIGTFTISCIALSLHLTMLLPTDKLSRTVPMASVIIFLFMFKSVFAVLMYGFFMRGRKFSAQMWDSKFHN